MQKTLEENNRFFMNEAFRGAFESKLDSYMSKNYAGDDYEVRFKPNMCFRGVLNDFFFKITPASTQKIKRIKKWSHSRHTSLEPLGSYRNHSIGTSGNSEVGHTIGTTGQL